MNESCLAKKEWFNQNSLSIGLDDKEKKRGVCEK